MAIMDAGFCPYLFAASVMMSMMLLPETRARRQGRAAC
jgi:hypothetical protein